MINLFDNYNQRSWDLHYSLISSGYNNPTISLEDDGFLPEDVTSPYQFYTNQVSGHKKPLYYNQVHLPKYWEIVGNNNFAEIIDMGKKRGHIHFVEPTQERNVKEVDWLDENGIVQLKDHYNKFGHLFAQTFFHENIGPVQKIYYNSNGFEVISENYVTGDIVLTTKEKLKIFHSKVDFVTQYLKDAKFELDRIFFNSLSTPMLVAYYLNEVGNDVLFWDEEIQEDVPGNLLALLNGSRRPTSVMVQNKKSYEKLLILLDQNQKEKIKFLGYQYPFVRPNLNQRNALILTNSDQILNCEDLVKKIPTLTFHIGALTEMSPKLMELQKYENVRLYPNISSHHISQLKNICDYYFDINQYEEILGASRMAFEHNMLILAFASTCHQKNYVSTDHIFNDDELDQFILMVEKCLKELSYLTQQVDGQREAANLETKENYKKLIN
ncbi:accessory Sec system glycosylation chaperone GtfB [Streptococcus uberis]|uniref:accessory Sec system glycosylation chaperone GtfB n=1 Tax=Streptococcus uberis TaxID=1349 RepID=UPI0027DB2F0C|nr:accessory Sec system glycosylation chaperone GtfB [Streptococcus uberis]MCK1224900.1 accessory Sec system glycosylation chaperone GtfB [Streptococcus uberis]